MKLIQVTMSLEENGAKDTISATTSTLGSVQNRAATSIESGATSESSYQDPYRSSSFLFVIELGTPQSKESSALLAK